MSVTVLKSVILYGSSTAEDEEMPGVAQMLRTPGLSHVSSWGVSARMETTAMSYKEAPAAETQEDQD